MYTFGEITPMWMTTLKQMVIDYAINNQEIYTLDHVVALEMQDTGWAVHVNFKDAEGMTEHDIIEVSCMEFYDYTTKLFIDNAKGSTTSV